MIEVRQIVLARSIQTIRSQLGTVGYLPDLVDQIKARYGFVKAPTEQELVPSDPPKGAVFLHGRVPNQDPPVIIDRLTVFNDGVVADTSSTTDDTDLFLADLAQWANTAIPRAVSSSGPRYYLSQIEIMMDPSLAAYAPRFNPLAQSITARLASYGIQVPAYEPSAINLYFDVLGKTGPQPGVFIFDRRLNFAYNENVWFTQAPLKTADHIALLREFANP